MKPVKILLSVGLILLIFGGIGVLVTYPKEPSAVVNEKRFSEYISTVHIAADNATVEVEPADGNETKVELIGVKDNKKQVTFEAKTEGDQLLVSMKEERYSLFNVDFFTRRYTVKVHLPKETYKLVTAESKNGRIQIGHIQGNRIMAMTNNGKIELSHLKGKEIEAKTRNGKIVLSDITVQQIEAHTTNGKMVMNRCTGTIQGRASNGKIELNLDRIESAIDLETANGKIEINTAEKPQDIKVLAQTENGSIRIFGEKYKTAMAVNKTGPLLKLETKNGAIIMNHH